MTVKKVMFDSDGTIYDLYGMNGWLRGIREEDPNIFTRGESLVDMSLLNQLCGELQEKGVEVGIITWLPKDATLEYRKACTATKKRWFSEHIPNIKIIHCVKYGTPKHTVRKELKGAYLFDDNEEVRKKWNNYGGMAFSEREIFEVIRGLLVD